MTKVLIVETDSELGQVWSDHIASTGVETRHSTTAGEAITALTEGPFDAIVLDLTLPDGGALEVADFASYRRPEAKVIFVTHGDDFADGSIFSISANATAFLQSDLPPEDLAAIVEYHAAAR